jgi:catechol 2,3-dioxygenase-like lactoylglutathione lyase family enzyme
MRIKLHEIELNTKDPAASRSFYAETLGLQLKLQEKKGLNVFDAGLPGFDFDTSGHRPGKTIVSFVTDDLPGFVSSLRQKGLMIEGPEPSHLGMMAVHLEDPDGHIVRIHGLTHESPAWLKENFGF